MKRNAAILVIVVSVLAGCAGGPARNTLTQVAVIDSLLAGVYDGDTPSAELLPYGDFGIGTFDGLDGEMILLDGTFYQIKADGKVYRPDPHIGTPFATVCRFAPEHRIAFNNPSAGEKIKQMVDNAVPNKNLFCAIKITGTFAKVKARSVPAQERPYPPLSEVVKHQSVFDLKYVSGTVVGFRSPPFVKGINVPGYHLHFISDDLSAGGHILAFDMQNGIVEVDEIDRFYLMLPAHTAAFGAVDLTRDRGRELKQVEE